MEVKLIENTLVIELPASIPPVESNSKKTLMLASSHGGTKVEIDGCIFWVNVNVYTYPALIDTFQQGETAPKKTLSAKEKAAIKKKNDAVTAKSKDKK